MARVPRPQGRNWRRNAYEYLVDRDGPACSRCGCEERTIWRNNGVCNNGEWGWEEEYRNRMSRVYPASNLEVDHQIPLHAGGTNDDDNLSLLCVECHKEKTISERRARAMANA